MLGFAYGDVFFQFHIYDIRFIDLPIGSMYGILTYIWLIFILNVGIYTIHGSYGIQNMSQISTISYLLTDRSRSSGRQKTCQNLSEFTEEVILPGGELPGGQAHLWFF